MNLGVALFWLATALALFVAAVVQAFQGDWAPALFLGLLWHGITNNMSLEAIRQRV